MTYTQGPWGIYIPEHDVTAWDEEAQQTVTVAIMADDEPKETREANARLVAASPEMLGSLIHLIELFENGSDGWSARDYRQHEENVLTEARNLIAKATGAEVEA